MLPTSIIGSMRSVPPQWTHVSPSSTCRMSAIAGREVAAVLDVPEVVVGPVRADHVAAVGDGRVEHDLAQRAVRHARRADRAGVGAEGGPDLLGLRRAVRPRRAPCQLQLVQAVVAAHDREHHAARLVLRHHDHRLRGQPLVDAEELGQRGDGADAGRVHLLDRRVVRRLDRPRDRDRHLDVGGVVAAVAQSTTRSSPAGDGAMYSCAPKPPIMPTSDSTL